MCEDYRAAAQIDLEHDRLDRKEGHILQMPLLVLWGEEGVVHSCFRPLDEWSTVAEQVEGVALPCGHYIAEEAPELLLDHALSFLFKPL
jgi:haloacetate dehalogenase